MLETNRRYDATAALVTGASRGSAPRWRGSSRAAERGSASWPASPDRWRRWRGPSARRAGRPTRSRATSATSARCYALAGAAAALVGPIDLLVHNASTLGKTPLPLLLDTDCEDLERVLAVNLVGPFRLTKAVAGSMALRRRGLIVHVSSDAAVNAYPGWGAYGVSKAALDHLGRSWAAELEGTGVRVLDVDPGEMNTRMHAEAIPDADPATLADPAVVAARIADLIVHAERVPSGARVEAARWEASS